MSDEAKLEKVKALPEDGGAILVLPRDMFLELLRILEAVGTDEAVALRGTFLDVVTGAYAEIESDGSESMRVVRRTLAPKLDS